MLGLYGGRGPGILVSKPTGSHLPRCLPCLGLEKLWKIGGRMRVEYEGFLGWLEMERVNCLLYIVCGERNYNNYV